MKFNAITDLDSEVLRDRALSEAKLIFANESTRRKRSLNEILVTSMYGLAAEVYLLQQGYIDDDRPYKDLYEPVALGGKPIEVKVTEGSYYVPYVIKRCEAAAKEKWREYPKRLYIFIGDKKTYDYSLHGIYEFDGVHFVKTDV